MNPDPAIAEMRERCASTQRMQGYFGVTGVTLKSLRRGGHVSTDYIVRKYWPQIKKFFDSAGIPVL